MQLRELEVMDRQRTAARAQAAVSAGTKRDRIFTRAAAKATALEPAASPLVSAAGQECVSHAVGSPTAAALDAAAMLLTPVRAVLLEEESNIMVLRHTSCLCQNSAQQERYSAGHCPTLGQCRS